MTCSEATGNELPELSDSRYAVVEWIGEGVAATVWRAVDRVSSETVALKLLKAESMRLEDVQRLALEVGILDDLDHPCIVKLRGTGVAREGNPYVAMEWVDGVTLRDRMVASAPMDAEDVADIVGQVGSALTEAHAHDVVHRDVKPENIMLCAPEHLAVKVLDFGMSKVLAEHAPALTAEGHIFGTPEYMAPERARGHDVSAATDVYALAVMAHEMLAGQRPFSARNPIQIMMQHIRATPPPVAGVAAEVNEALLEGMAKEPRRRPGALQFAQRLARALKGTGGDHVAV